MNSESDFSIQGASKADNLGLIFAAKISHINIIKHCKEGRIKKNNKSFLLVEPSNNTSLPTNVGQYEIKNSNYKDD